MDFFPVWLSLRVASVATVVTAVCGVPLAWLLALSPVMLPIPGTATLAHLDENVAAASIELSGEEVARLTEVGR